MTAYLKRDRDTQGGAFLGIVRNSPRSNHLKGENLKAERSMPGDSRVWLRDRKYKLEKHKKVRLGKDKGRGKYHRVWDYLSEKK